MALAACAERFPVDVGLTRAGRGFSAKGDVGVGAQSGSAKVELRATVPATAALPALAGSAFRLPPALPQPLQFSGRIEQTAAAIALPAFKLTRRGR